MHDRQCFSTSRSLQTVFLMGLCMGLCMHGSPDCTQKMHGSLHACACSGCGRMHACMLTIGVCTMTRMCDPNDLMSAALNQRPSHLHPLRSFSIRIPAPAAAPAAALILSTQVTELSARSDPSQVGAQDGNLHFSSSDPSQVATDTCDRSSSFP